MKNSSDIMPETSRRNFTKSIVASLVAAPFVSSLAGCSHKQETITPRLPARIPCEPLVGGAPHEPPIGFEDGGSLMLEVPEDNEIKAMNVPNDVRPFKHTLGTANYTSINGVTVLTRPMDGHPSFVRYLLVENPIFQLRIWLVHLLENPGVLEDTYETVDPNAVEPQLILKPTAPHIEAQGQFQDVGKSHKHSVPFRYKYPQMANERHFRIGEWRITDDRGNIVKDSDGNLFRGGPDDSTQIFVSFNHPE